MSVIENLDVGVGLNFRILSKEEFQRAFFAEKFRFVEKDGITAGRNIEGKSWEALKSQSHTEMNTLIVQSMWAI